MPVCRKRMPCLHRRTSPGCRRTAQLLIGRRLMKSVSRRRETPHPLLAKTFLISGQRALQSGPLELRRDARTRRRDMAHQLLWMELVGEVDSGLAAVDPGDGAGDAELTLAKLDCGAFDRQFVALD